jgi:nucleotide-binding universal stress UspA family protein
MTAKNVDLVPRIVVAVDGSSSSRTALDWAVRQAELTGAILEAVIVWRYPASAGTYGWAPVSMQDQDTDFRELAEKTLTDAINAAVDPASDIIVRPRVAQGNPAQVLLDVAKDADLLVVGSRGHGGLAGALLGSVSQHCVHHARCPVVVVHGQVHST